MRIATQIVADAFQHNCDLAIIVSADSDMIPAVELAKEAKINVFISIPALNSNEMLFFSSL